jgi:hypothetical protein
MVLQFPARLKAISIGHNHVEQDQIGAFSGYSLLQLTCVVDGNGPISGLLQHRFHQFDLG